MKNQWSKHFMVARVENFDSLLTKAEQVQQRPYRRCPPRELEFIGKLRGRYEEWGDATLVSQAEVDWLTQIADS